MSDTDPSSDDNAQSANSNPTSQSNNVTGATLTNGTGTSFSTTSITISNASASNGWAFPPLTGPVISAKVNANSAILELTGENPILRTKYGDINLAHFIEMMRQLSDILCSVKPSVEQLEEYPALKNAYLHYQIIERLVRDPPSPDQ